MAQGSYPSSSPDSSSSSSDDSLNVDHEEEEGTTARTSSPPMTRRMRRRRRSPPPPRLLFASCNNQNLSSPLWDAMAARDAAAFVWGGDSIYSDRFVGLDWTHLPPRAIHQEATPALLRKYYSEMLSDPGYRRLLATNLTVFGTIDDHDYGQNNGDRTYEHSRESGAAFVEFTGEPFDSPISERARAGYGVYGVKVFDFARPPGQELVTDVEAGIDPDVVGYDEEDECGVDDDERGDKGGGGKGECGSGRTVAYSDRSVAVFVLDCRTNRDPWGKGRAAWRPDESGDFLGERQWRWFEAAVRRSRASVNVIVNGLQVHSDRFPSSHVAEEWVKFPASRRRLYRAALTEGLAAPILISGDVHMSQLMRKDCFRGDGGGGGVDDDGSAGSSGADTVRPLIEMTASGLTHSWGTGFASSEKYHTTWRRYYVSFGSRVSMLFGHWICPWYELMKTPSSGIPGTFENGGDEGAKVGKQFALDKNFGELEFDFDARTVRARIVGVEGGESPLLSAKWSFDQLSGRETMPGGVSRRDASEYRRRHPGAPVGDGGEWICVNHRGEAHPFHVLAANVSGTFVFMSLLSMPYLVCFACLRWTILAVIRRKRKV